MENIVKLENVKKVYGGAVETLALSDINLTIEKGSFCSIVGESGSGKSTLLNILGTLDQPTSGKLIIDGKDTVGLSNNELAALRNMTIGFVFQFHYLLPEFTALENVLIPWSISRKKVDSAVIKRAAELMKTMGIDKIKDKMVNKLSGGQQQRTAIARALINNPSILLADEPTGNLDSENGELIYRIFRELNRDLHTTFIVVTHDRRIAEQTDRIIEIRDGKIFSDSKTYRA